MRTTRGELKREGAAGQNPLKTPKTAPRATIVTSIRLTRIFILLRPDVFARTFAVRLLIAAGLIPHSDVS